MYDPEYNFWPSILWGLFWCAFWGRIACEIGKKKGMEFGAFLLGFLLGPIGVLIALASNGNRVKCPFCKAFIDPTASVCSYCQSKLSSIAKDMPPTKVLPLVLQKAVSSCTWRLIAIHGTYIGRFFDLTQHRVTVGQNEDNDIALPEDPSLAPKHVELIRVNGAYILNNTDTLCPATVNGSYADTQVPLQTGDEVQIGNTIFLVEPVSTYINRLAG